MGEKRQGTMVKKSSEQGFTLTELMVAIVIFSVVMGAIYTTYMSQQKAYRVTETVTEAQQNLRSAMWNLERDIRMAGYNSKGISGAFGFQSLGTAPTEGTTTLAFSYDQVEDGLAGVTEYVRYRRNTGTNTLQRGVGVSGGPPPTAWSDSDIAENITSMAVQYYDSSGNVTATASAVRTVLVTLTATLDDHARTLSTRIQCRNMGL